MEAMLYRGMNQSQLDQAYDNTKAARDVPSTLGDFQQRSRQIYATHFWRRNLSYGERPRERYDFLS